MRVKDEAEVRAIYAACHPGWPQRAPRWYEVFPTLVAVDDDTVVGFCSYSVAIPPKPEITAMFMLYGQDIGVRPDYQGRGLGRRLAEARFDAGRAVGAKVYMGFTQPDNGPMIRIFEEQGLKPCGAIDGYYAHTIPATPAVIYIGPVT